MRALNKTWIVYFIIISVAFILRAPYFSALLLDDDEGIILLMGRVIAAGELPYIHYWDHQTPLPFYLSSLFEFMGFKALYGLRILWTVWVILCAGLFFSLGTLLNIHKLTGFLTGLVYIYLTGYYKSAGLAIQNELLINFLNLSGIYILVKGYKNNTFELSCLTGGLIFGLSVMTKQNAIFDLIPILGACTWYGRKKPKSLFVLFSGLLMPFAILYAYYSLKGHSHELLDAIWFSNFKYIQNESINKFSVFYLLSSLKPTIVFLFLVLFIQMGLALDRLRVWLIIWLGLSIYSNTISGTLYVHYFLQTLIPLMLLFLYSFSELSRVDLFNRMRKFLFIIFIFLLGPKSLMDTGGQKQDDLILKTVSDFLKLSSHRNDSLYTYDAPQILYWLCDFKPLTILAFPDHHLRTKYSNVTPVGGQDEFIRIMEQNPTWVTLDKREDHNFRNSDDEFISLKMSHYLKSRYELVKIFNLPNKKSEGIWIYRLRAGL